MLVRWKQRLAPLLVAQWNGSSISFLELVGGHWREVDRPDRSSSPAQKLVLLIPDTVAQYKLCSFPCDLVPATALDEAIMLGQEEWNPFAEESRSFSWVGRVHDRWLVAHWVWPLREEERLLAQLPSGATCTHIVPMLAWKAAQVDTDGAPVLLIDGDRHALLDRTGMPVRVAQCVSSAAAQRFWRGLGGEAEQVARAVCIEKTPTWVPPHLVQTAFTARTPNSVVFQRGKRPGVRDFFDPWGWRKPIAALLSLLLLWIIVDAATLTWRNEAVSQQLTTARQRAKQVLQDRADVQHLYHRLTALQDWRRQQWQTEHFLAKLSVTLPNTTWLDVLHMGDGWADLRGQGRNVIELPALLGALPDVNRATMLNAVQPDAKTGLARFQLRLMFSDRVRAGEE